MLKTLLLAAPAELPPRARRILPSDSPLKTLPGTTSACAENTVPAENHCAHCWNYLRVRGEYEVFHHRAANGEELPPRARRIPIIWFVLVVHNGTTSACAENTISSDLYVYGPWNYLRVRGEYGGCRLGQMWSWELPPRARRIHHSHPPRSQREGTTSACAENTISVRAMR